MMTPKQDAVDWHWVATTMLSIVVLLVGSWANSNSNKVEAQSGDIISLRLTDERREEQMKAITSHLSRIETQVAMVLVQLEQHIDEQPPCSTAARTAFPRGKTQ
jgi:hypothetical protein